MVGSDIMVKIKLNNLRHLTWLLTPTMPITFNAAQQAILDYELRFYRRILGEKRPPRDQIIVIAIQVSAVGPKVSPQTIGK